jgi:AraC-like DNA-binding protein
MHPRPGYREFAAPPPLAGAVACLWMRVVPPGDPPLRVLPDACVDLVWEAGRGAFVAGPDTAINLVHHDGPTVYVGGRLLPGAGGPALQVPLCELRDSRVEATELWPELGDDLPATLTPPEALARMTSTLSRLVGAGPPDPAVRRAAGLLAHPGARVDELAGDLGLSERQLLRRCQAAVGYGPKTLHRVLRFRRFLALAGAGRGLDLARVALDAGYADQAHLTRECTRLAGLPPAALLRARAGGDAPNLVR